MIFWCECGYVTNWPDEIESHDKVCNKSHQAIRPHAMGSDGKSKIGKTPRKNKGGKGARFSYLAAIPYMFGKGRISP